MIKVKGVINATKEELEFIGCDRDLMGLELDISDIDKWGGISPPSSTVHYTHVLSENYSFEEEYIIPTKWITFK